MASSTVRGISSSRSTWHLVATVGVEHEGAVVEEGGPSHEVRAAVGDVDGGIDQLVGHVPGGLEQVVD